MLSTIIACPKLLVRLRERWQYNEPKDKAKEKLDRRVRNGGGKSGE